VIEVRGGTYPGPLVVQTEGVTLEGVDTPNGAPVIDGGGQGTVVTLAAPGVVLRGFEVRGSGVEPDRDHAGIILTAPRIVVENNRLHDVLFGIFVAQADDAVLRGNDITSKAQYDQGRKGDGIRLWYSQRVTVENNTVHAARDVVMWYSQDVVVRGNVIERGRYGIHLMYCDNAQIEHNQILDNSVGIYTMYSADVVLRENLIRGQRGPSGYALGFKDADNVEVTDNALVDNRAGTFLDGTPFNPAAFGKFQNNLFAFNDVGVILLPAVRGNTFENNTFWENVEQVAVQGGGTPGQNLWQGNYWSDYTGFDADGDGLGDVPYRAERFFENLTDREPRLRALIYSPAAQAVEFAGSAFPIVRPQPKFTDPAPRVQPGPIPSFAVLPKSGGRGMGVAALALFGVSLAMGALVLVRGDSSMQRKALTAKSAESGGVPWNAPTGAVNQPTVRVRNVGKRYGSVPALSGVSFEAHAGEALALWGANGAGKTTLIKAVLGLIDFDGKIEVEGHDVRRAGKSARRSIGYVPQEAIFYDLSVQATMEFYARLKGSRGVQLNAPARIPVLLENLGLAGHARKPVPALSGGLKQRLALAIALLADPPVLLLDEPTASLDAKAQHDYLALLARLRSEERKTIIFASHRLEEVEALANRVLVLEHGRLVDVLNPVDLLAKLMPEIQLTLYVPEAQRPDALACLAGAGLAAHLNGRGTVVVRVRAEDKMQPLQTLLDCGIPVTNFETAGTVE
ncbi:MAG: ABC transporter related protein, partial [Anaerolineales bacterium]|nr:ABC transporter related protein [Anaerolineales bacterium]